MTLKTNLTAKHLGKRLIINGAPFIAGICLHDTAGSGTHNDTLYLANPSDGRVVSVDFTVERDGTVYQLNPDLRKNCTWHAGRATKFKAGSVALRNREVTQSLIGIELVHSANPNRDNPIWPDEQVKAVAELCVALCERFGLGKDRITTHAAIITDGSRSDPRNFPFETFWFHFNRAANIPAVDPPAGTLGAPIIHKVQAGETLWSIAKKYGQTIEGIKALNNMSEPSNLIRVGQVLVIGR